ncbi:hypothetical protein QUF88_25445 [Bacillus sp. DX1.1]|uniref:hypothetical protein n=1 Tax=unclassified Bacillus (in: firmicutes) TaxID=185979 RepID=UPI0025711BC8|nr:MULTISPECIES: hypothetical protein [unclassified Bacillus (in: firmicutes)]MDM5157031.1 hypothetical protein [Bacillus sp. DX1.1]WJE81268.1 hypothetical protein QRE67_22985 [Bacillus sp. DX3.1]
MEEQGVLAGLFAGLFALGVFVIFIIFIWGILSYLLTAFALYTMAKNEEADDAVFAFIPFLNSKVLGDLVREKLPASLKADAGWKVFGVYIACFILSFVPIIHILASVVMIALSIYLIYAVLDRYGTNAVLFTILHVITCCIFLPIHLFVIRKETPRY